MGRVNEAVVVREEEVVHEVGDEVVDGEAVAAPVGVGVGGVGGGGVVGVGYESAAAEIAVGVDIVE